MVSSYFSSKYHIFLASCYLTNGCQLILFQVFSGNNLLQKLPLLPNSSFLSLQFLGPALREQQFMFYLPTNLHQVWWCQSYLMHGMTNMVESLLIQIAYQWVQMLLHLLFRLLCLTGKWRSNWCEWDTNTMLIWIYIYTYKPGHHLTISKIVDTWYIPFYLKSCNFILHTNLIISHTYS